MKNLNEYILKHTARGECQCGSCCDKMPDREAPRHSVDVHFFWVTGVNEPTKDGLAAVLHEYPEPDRLRSGPSYIELGAVLGSQELALRLIGLGQLVGLWRAVTPEAVGIAGAEAKRLAGNGFVMMTGVNPQGAMK